MIRRLYLNNCFTHQDRTFLFNPGLTGIVGQNEAGKSLVVEMIRFALFGSKALRGEAADYKKLHVELDFTVRDEEYTVLRKGSKVHLSGAREASGTSPVNEAIRDILGYGLDVFDVANACNQGNVEALSNMTPAARRAMVDRTVGLNVLDDLIAFCGTEGNTWKRTAAAAAAQLVEPTAPVRPEGVEHVDPAPLQAAVRELTLLRGSLQSAPPMPEAPQLVEFPDDLEAHEAQRLNIIASNSAIERQLANLRPETFPESLLAEIEGILDLNDRITAKQRLLAQGHLCCPSCDHKWPVAADALKAYADVPDAKVAVDMSRNDVAAERRLQGNTTRIAELKSQIQEVPVDLSATLRGKKEQEARLLAYGRALDAYEAFHRDLNQKRARVAELMGSEEKLAEVEAANRKLWEFETMQRGYETLLARYEATKALVEEHEAKSVEYLTARERLQDLKVKVKSMLLPSLNTVASRLLHQMTGGERFKVEVDDDFEIMIDDQKLGTLSGSGKAVANLAIRIALGQILTNRVFSVFIADEVDAAMDDTRAAYTAEALRRLTDHVNQVVQVTHKRPDTDHLIELRR